MKLKNLHFDQWLDNHSSDHDDKWCRELYPFHVFGQVNFDQSTINEEQKFYFNGMSYYVIIKKIDLQNNGRNKASFGISTVPKNKTQEWKQRRWNTEFQIVYSQHFDFITVFTRKEDPSKDYVVRFMKGNFEKINNEKSIPISELLIKTLILHILEDAFPGGIHNQKFEFLKKGINDKPEHPQFPRKKINQFSPIYSIERNLWIYYSFTEEKAHRIAFHNSNQCDELIVIYCNPTYTRHHRCNYEGVKIISIYQLSEIVSPLFRKKYEKQIRFLQNHLNLSEKVDIKTLLSEINEPKKVQYEIEKSDLMEAFATMKIIPNSDADFFHSLCCINLINSYLSIQRQNKQQPGKDNKLFRNMYSFKTYLGDILTERIKNKNFSLPICIDKNLIIVEIYNFQFSFHNVPLNQTLQEFANCVENRPIMWSGKRLQPIAPLLLKYSRAKRLE